MVVPLSLLWRFSFGLDATLWFRNVAPLSPKAGDELPETAGGTGESKKRGRGSSMATPMAIYNDLMASVSLTLVLSCVLRTQTRTGANAVDT